MSPRFILGRENVPCVAEVVNRSLKADCTDFTGGGKASSISQLNCFVRPQLIQEKYLQKSLMKLD